MEIELVSSYKKPFVQKRYLQTILGGLNLKIGNDTPIYAYLIQIVVFIIPWILSGILTLFLEFNIFGLSLSFGDYIYAAVYGLLVFLFVFITQLTSISLQRRTSEVTRLTDGVQNILSEEDEVEFDSCLSPHVVQYLIPVKQFKVNILFHSLLSGLICGLGLLYLTPSTFYLLYSNTVITVIWYIGGWLVLCIAQYSLTVRAPPEMAAFRTTDVAELASLSRPFYVLVFLLLDLLWRCFPAWNLLLLNQVLHIVFIMLPVFWSWGLLPPLEALVLWLMEQFLIHALGGSPMATNLRLILMLFISGCSLAICSLLPSILPIILFSALTGYILSVDISGLANFAVEKLLRLFKKPRSTSSQTVNDEVVFVQHGSHWVLVVVHHAVLVVFTGGVTIAMYYYSAAFSNTVWQILGISIIVAAKLETLLRQCQQVYVFGLFRNCLYPRDVNHREKFKKRKRKLKFIGVFHKFVMNFVMPVIMVIYISLGISVSAATGPSFSLALGSCRAFRWIWQSTSNSLLEISVVHFVNSVIQPSPTSTWTSMGLGLQLLVVGLARDRLFQVLHKLYTYLTILVTSYTVKKQRRSSTVPLIVVSVFLFPFVFLLILIAGALSAPILPLFTLPVILVGFPRPMRFWPGGVGNSASVCRDTIFYTEMVPQLVAAFQKALSAGSLGAPQPGYHYILRFQDRMVWVQIMECGFGYYSLSVKGMELQETSCHTVEASELEAQFEVAFENEISGCCSLNPYIAHTMTPMDVINFKTYSDAKSTLTGIIDSPDTLTRINAAFYKTLLWVLVRHVLERKDYSPRKSSSKSLQGRIPLSVSSPSRLDGVKSRTLSAASHQQADSKKATQIREPCPSKDSGHPESSQSRPHSVISYELKKSSSWSSLGSCSDDDGGLEMDKVQPERRDAGSRPTSDDLFDDLPGTVKVEDEEEDLLRELEFGLPAVDKGTPKHGGEDSRNIQQRGVGIKLANSIQFKSPHSSRLSLPFKWREIPIDPGTLQPLLGNFSTDWFKSILLHLQLESDGKSSQEVADEMTSDPALLEMYSYLTTACHLVLCGDGLLAGKNGPWHVYRAYCGDPPWSPHLEWMSEDGELFSIAKQAFRLAFKLAYDQIVLGEGDEDEDLITNLEDYESNWYLGSDTDEEWKEAIKRQKPELFSLMFNPQENTYHGRVLSHQPVMAYVGSLNQEMVRALWSSLSLELLYMTNDDEERYSIQAHPIILRNLTVQSADPPLGYPIYASPPISVPTL